MQPGRGPGDAGGDEEVKADCGQVEFCGERYEGLDGVMILTFSLSGCIVVSISIPNILFNICVIFDIHCPF